MLSLVPGAPQHSHSQLLFPMMRIQWEGRVVGGGGAASEGGGLWMLHLRLGIPWRVTASRSVDDTQPHAWGRLGPSMGVPGGQHSTSSWRHGGARGTRAGTGVHGPPSFWRGLQKAFSHRTRKGGRGCCGRPGWPGGPAAPSHCGPSRLASTGCGHRQALWVKNSNNCALFMSAACLSTGQGQQSPPSFSTVMEYFKLHLK